ncbi:MAG: hypothetical protein D5S01_05520 [Halanaerobium sp. MSAO_Bac5]|nr:MAG: hypothetical protein D5S01_05520 [Halanaerobium sp. MSAO_Bac5]
MKNLIVIKIGGSFFRDSKIETLKKISDIIQESNKKKILIVCGGGSAADLVRNFDKKVNLTDQAAHFAAITAMDLNSYLLSSYFNESSFLTADLELKNRINLFAAQDYYRSFDPLPHSWQVSSDSIALEVAQRLKADKLILLKQRYYNSSERKDRNTAKRTIKADLLAADGLIDSFFSSLYLKDKNQLSALIINANQPIYLQKYFSNKKSVFDIIS